MQLNNTAVIGLKIKSSQEPAGAERSNSQHDASTTVLYFRAEFSSKDLDPLWVSNLGRD